MTQPSNLVYDFSMSQKLGYAPKEGRGHFMEFDLATPAPNKTILLHLKRLDLITAGKMKAKPQPLAAFQNMHFHFWEVREAGSKVC